MCPRDPQLGGGPEVLEPDSGRLRDLTFLPSSLIQFVLQNQRCRPLSSACAAILSHRHNSPRTTSRLPWDPFKSHIYPLQQRWGCYMLFDRLCCCRRSIGGRAQAAPSCRSRCVLHVPQLNLDSLDSLCGGSHSNISNISYPSLHVSGRMPSSLRRPRSCTLTRTWRR